MKRLAIFDFDGTLVDTVHDVVECMNRALEINGFPTLVHDEFVNRLGGNINEIVSLILDDKSTPENIELIKKTYQELYDDSPKEKSVPFRGVHGLLLKLQNEGMLIAINSNRSTDSIRIFTDRFFDDIDFLLIEGHNPDYPSKPSPIGVEKIIEKAGVSLEESVYIGDSKTDIKTAMNAKIDCVIVTWGYGNQKDYDNTYLIKTVHDTSQLEDISEN